MRGLGVPSVALFAQLTNQTDITMRVAQYVQGLDTDRARLRDTFAAVEVLKPLFLSLPPGRATSHRVSTAAGASMDDRPLGGAVMLDGRADTWAQRLEDRSDAYYSGTGPVVWNHFEARELRAEYASLNFKDVGGGEQQGAGQFPQTVDGQRQLVAQLYDAIKSMDDILENKRPISIKKRNSNGAGGQKRKSDESGEAGEAGEAEETKETREVVDESADEAGGQVGAAMKESISVRKVKSLSRIEVEMLGWDLLVGCFCLSVLPSY